MEQPFWEQQSFPEKLFRLIVLLCIVGWGLSVIYIASHVGPLDEPPTRTRDLASFFFTAALIFIFFYAQYRVVPRFIHRDLDRRIGLWHGGGSLVLLIIGALNAASPQGRADVPSTLLFWMTLLGEAAFLGNVIWSYVHGQQPVPLLPVAPSAQTKAKPERVPDESAKNMGWPKSPAKLFGIGAAVFAAGGIISLILDVPSFKIPVPWSGDLHFLPYGLLWLAAAAPFAIFALLYRFLMETQNLVFEDRLNRIHFVTTIIAVLDLVRVFMSWQQWMGTKFATFYFPDSELRWLAVLFGLSAVVFVINAIRSYRRNTVRA